jgi:hypothetical protein
MKYYNKNNKKEGLTPLFYSAFEMLKGVKCRLYMIIMPSGRIIYI